MSQTLGEKLREAREERGISLSEVAEQTRISPHYIESIERDDYKPLPGGIFNKGFVKSFAKYVGVDEQEALADYSRAIAAKEGSDEADLKVYKPEVLTDDSSARSMIPTIIIAALILGLMTAGILFGLDYLNSPADPPKAANANSSNTGTNSNSAVAGTTSDATVPEMATLKIEFKTTSQPVRLLSTVDGEKSDNVVAAGSSKLFEPKESITLNYNRWNSSVVQLTINGKTIALPSAPLTPADKDRINFTISKENIATVWTSGSISNEVPPATTTETNTSTTPPAATGLTVVKPTPAPKPTTAANTATSPAKTPDPKPAATPRAAPTTAKPAANGPN
ncbi:MAG: helix-turn-helix domain-containing protein [Pyrinomonadaceae bacterium]|nr:helix-turn-helix domain-containing protein [Acidobacteriota bacterium]MBK7935243.1 helix-turn-helix domain-containing protein [Acidobacteriota bacterium]MBP7376462.1 helix-turn-helix domain-containing protein [Pyrinomonadaceae bacterium]